MAGRAAAVAAVVGIVVLLGWWWRRRDGRVHVPVDGAGRFDQAQLAAVGLGATAATDAFAVLLGSPTCAPCETVHTVLEQLARERPGLRWVHVDAADHLDLARSHRVMRVPTLFLLDPDGAILARTSGVPAARDLVAVLDRRS